MLGKWRWRLVRISRLLWFRTAIFSVLAVLASLASIYLAPLVPDSFSNIIGSDAVDNILSILASSMLAVTTFSLTVMVTAYGAASSSATPRATKLLIEDTTTQNALGTFLGSFLFSLVGIIALSTGLYGEKGRVILFGATLFVVIFIVITFVRWIDYLSTLGRVGETIQRVEAAATRALCDRIENPHLGGAELVRPGGPFPRGAVAIRSGTFGYLQHIDVAGLSRCAGDSRKVHVPVLPGQFIGSRDALAWLEGEPNEEAIAQARSMFTIADERSFDQDPRFGLIVLTEIALRALSPAMNDPGTAIDVIGRAIRVLALWIDGSVVREGEVPHPNVLLPSLRLEDLFDDVFTAIARDGTGSHGVQIRLLKALGMLSALDHPEAAGIARRHACRVLAQARAGAALEQEICALEDVARETFPDLKLG